jgi:hypothetical protein
VGLEVDSIEIIQLERFICFGISVQRLFLMETFHRPNKRPMRGGSSSFSFLQRLAAVPLRDLGGRVWRSDLLDFRDALPFHFVLFRPFKAAN